MRFLYLLFFTTNCFLSLQFFEMTPFVFVFLYFVLQKYFGNSFRSVIWNYHHLGVQKSFPDSSSALRFHRMYSFSS